MHLTEFASSRPADPSKRIETSTFLSFFLIDPMLTASWEEVEAVDPRNLKVVGEVAPLGEEVEEQV